MRGVGIIGTGRHGSRYANHIINDMEEMELTAIARRSPEGKDQADVWRTKWYGDWQALISDPDVEAVIAAVPPFLNLAIAGECAAAGKPLLVEKPLATNSREAAEIVSLMQEAGLSLTVGQTLRYSPVIKSLKARIKEMGAVYSFTANQRLEPSTLVWHDVREIAGAGVVFHTAIHIFDALRFITDVKIKRVKAEKYLLHNKNLEDLVVILVEMDNGVAGTVDISKVSHARSGRFEFICHDGHLYGEQIHSFVEVVRSSDLQRVEELPQVNTILQLLKDWGDFLDGKRKNPIPGEAGLYAVKVCDACLESAFEDRWVEVL